MSEHSHAFETCIWTDAQSLSTAKAIASRMGRSIHIIGVGGDRQSKVKDLAIELGADLDDDLRRMLVSKPATYLLLATMKRVEPGIITTALQQGTTVLALEPIAADFRELEQCKLFVRHAEDRDRSRIATSGHYVHCPAFTQSPGWLAAADPQLVLGNVRSSAVLSSTRQGGLFARLHEAWRIVLDVMQLPESVDCSIIPSGGAPPESLRELTGQIAVHARMADEGSAVFQLHDVANAAAPSPCDRLIQLVGERGRLRVTDHAYQLFDHEGALLDEAAPTPRIPSTLADAVAHHWKQLIERPALADPPRRDRARHEAAALACCLACLLSARTGTAESPGKLLAVHGWK